MSLTKRTLDLVCLSLGIIGISLFVTAAHQVNVSNTAQACFMQLCSGSWTVNSSSCDDLFRCQCGASFPSNTCYRERGFCNGSEYSNDVVFRKCYLGFCSCSNAGVGGGGGSGGGYGGGGNWCYADSDCGVGGTCGVGGLCDAGGGY